MHESFFLIAMESMFLPDWQLCPCSRNGERDFVEMQHTSTGADVSFSKVTVGVSLFSSNHPPPAVCRLSVCLPSRPSKNDSKIPKPSCDYLSSPCTSTSSTCFHHLHQRFARWELHFPLIFETKLEFLWRLWHWLS
jgi:hypothetical protein